MLGLLNTSAVINWHSLGWNFKIPYFETSGDLCLYFMALLPPSSVEISLTGPTLLQYSVLPFPLLSSLSLYHCDMEMLQSWIYSSILYFRIPPCLTWHCLPGLEAWSIDPGCFNTYRYRHHFLYPSFSTTLLLVPRFVRLFHTCVVLFWDSQLCLKFGPRCDWSIMFPSSRRFIDSLCVIVQSFVIALCSVFIFGIAWPPAPSLPAYTAFWSRRLTWDFWPPLVWTSIFLLSSSICFAILRFACLSCAFVNVCGLSKLSRWFTVTWFPYKQCYYQYAISAIWYWIIMYSLYLYLTVFNFHGTC